MCFLASQPCRDKARAVASGGVNDDISHVIDQADGNVTGFPVIIPVIDLRKDRAFEDKGSENQIDAVLVEVLCPFRFGPFEQHAFAPLKAFPQIEAASIRLVLTGLVATFVLHLYIQVLFTSTPACDTVLRRRD
jgi:hypothetical protein